MYNIKPGIKFYQLCSFSPWYFGGDFSLTLSIFEFLNLILLGSVYIYLENVYTYYGGKSMKNINFQRVTFMLKKIVPFKKNVNAVFKCFQDEHVIR